jgi:hypothetical protein
MFAAPFQWAVAVTVYLSATAGLRFSVWAVLAFCARIAEECDVVQ